MAKDLELEKNSSENPGLDGADESKASKDDKKSKSKSSKDAKDGKNAKKGKGKQKKSIVKYFKDARSEFKKVVWPTPKETTRNTIVVLIVCIVAGLVVFGLDSLFGLFNRLLVNLAG